MGNIFTDLFSSDDANKAAADKIAYAQQGQTQGNAALDTGLATANPLYQQAYQPFSQLYTQSQPGMSAYADATGANGTAGLTRAQTNYQADPGYNGGLTTGVDQLNRTAAARGDSGGNNSADILKFASDYDNQKYSSYVSNLAPWLSAGQSAASGGASVLGAQAGANLGVASQKAGIDTSTANTEGNAQAQADMAPYTASQNFWGALMGGGKLALSAFGGPSGSASALSSGSGVPSAFGPTSVGGPNGPSPLVSGSFY